ncbi:MAG: DUF3445 domain-containing protein [Cyanobacteriota bacterium]|nr:DUF3445 domain-containing protein [Cyanobacteriota bacterium]
MYLPFTDRENTLRLGLKPLDVSDWIEIDKDLRVQLKLKEQLLRDRFSEVFVSLPSSLAGQRETLTVLLEHLLTHFPHIYRQHKNGIENRISGQYWTLEEFQNHPLDLTGRLVQEDFCLMLPSSEGYRLEAASVCFPLRWRLREKLGKPLDQIHSPVPGYAETLKHPVDNLFERLKPNASGLRFNWSLVDTPKLFLPPSQRLNANESKLTADGGGERIWVRVERQTLRRLQKSRGVLFGIRTYVYPLSHLDADALQHLVLALRQMPPETQEYKQIEPLRAVVLNQL